MKTRKLILVVLYVFLTCVLSEKKFLDKKQSKLEASQNLITSEESFDLDFADKVKDAFHEDLNDARQNENFGTKDRLESKTIYKSKRAIDASR